VLPSHNSADPVNIRNADGATRCCCFVRNPEPSPPLQFGFRIDRRQIRLARLRNGQETRQQHGGEDRFHVPAPGAISESCAADSRITHHVQQLFNTLPYHTGVGRPSMAHFEYGREVQHISDGPSLRFPSARFDFVKRIAAPSPTATLIDQPLICRTAVCIAIIRYQSLDARLQTPACSTRGRLHPSSPKLRGAIDLAPALAIKYSPVVAFGSVLSRRIGSSGNLVNPIVPQCLPRSRLRPVLYQVVAEVMRNNEGELVSS